MSFALTDRHKRQDDIKKGLDFVQSSLPYFGTPKEYEIFLMKLIRNLFNEGNELYKEGLKNDSINQYSEALSLSNYAASEDIIVTSMTVERLHVNRAMCNLDMGLHKEALKDCGEALRINDRNLRALYCKSRALFFLEKYKDAYDAVARCSLIAPKDESVVKLTQDLAMKLGLKIRKAYIRSQPGNKGAHMDTTKKMTNCLSDRLEPDLPEVHEYESPLSSLSSLSVNAEILRESSPLPGSVSPSMHSVAEVGIFPSALSCSETSTLFPISYLRDEIIGDELDRMLDSVPTSNNLGMTSSALPGSSRTNAFNSMQPLSSYPGYGIQKDYTHLSMPTLNSLSLNPLPIAAPQSGVSVLDQVNGPNTANHIDASPFQMIESSYFHQTDSPVDASGICKKAPLLESVVVNGGPLSATSGSPSKILNPLENTHEFKQACQLCFSKTGSKLQNCSYNPMEHKCKKDILIGRIKKSADETWKCIRPKPTKNLYAGQYYICKDVAQGNDCKYPVICTFAYCQEEIDVWTLERKGAFCRETLFGGNRKVIMTIPRMLQECSGTFFFLCEKCFDHKPRMISMQSKENKLICSHPVFKHNFEENKCLVHMYSGTVLKYSKIRPYTNNKVVIDLCRHESRYGCLREDDCYYAHSIVEVRVWLMQKETGILFEDIVQQSLKYWTNKVKENKPQNNPPGNPPFTIKIACGQCWTNGQVIEADKYKKYCSSKATHQWVKDRQVVLVMSNARKKWISVRTCPCRKPYPLQFEMCHHVLNGKKCQYIGNCAFAHSQEEKEVWSYIRDVGIDDMEKLCEKMANDKKIQRVNEASSEVKKQIHLPTDYAETTVDFHCWLCGKNCNSERQWKMHISSEKHKEKVFHSEDDQNIWQHRFPTGCFSLCKRLSSSCPEGEKCKFAHGNAELQEWEERSKVLCQKLERARKDKLISPDDNDFGKYSFLINAFN